MPPSNTNRLPAEVHSHDEVGFARAWTRAEQDEWARKRVRAMQEASEDPEFLAWLAGWKADLRADAERRKTAPTPRKLTDEEFDAREERMAWVDGYDEDHDHRGYLIVRDEKW